MTLKDIDLDKVKKQLAALKITGDPVRDEREVIDKRLSNSLENLSQLKLNIDPELIELAKARAIRRHKAAIAELESRSAMTSVKLDHSNTEKWTRYFKRLHFIVTNKKATIATLARLVDASRTTLDRHLKVATRCIKHDRWLPCVFAPSQSYEKIFDSKFD